MHKNSLNNVVHMLYSMVGAYCPIKNFFEGLKPNVYCVLLTPSLDMELQIVIT